MKKLMNKKAFTLMEMLIVVAIIAVLVAIAIPTMQGAMTKAKEAADVANIRAAYAEYQVAALTSESSLAVPTTIDELMENYGDDQDLNFATSSHGATYAVSTSNVNEATIKYVAKKIGGTNGNTYTWTIGDGEPTA